MNNETLLSQAKIEAEKRYNSGDGYMANRYAFTAGVEYAITHLQAQQGERLWREVDVKERLPAKQGVYFVLTENGSKNHLFHSPGLEKFVTSAGTVTHWLEEIPAPAPWNEAVGWISVDDKLPDMINDYPLMKTSAYIMYANQYGIYIGWCGIFTVDCTGNGWEKGDVYFSGLGRNKEKATHWQPLPAPPPTTVHPL